MNRWIAVVATLALVALVGVMAWNAGMAHGIAQSGRMVAPPGGPYAYPYMGWHYGPGFFFAPFFFIFIFMIFFGLLRTAIWGRHGHRFGCGYRDLDEWHRNVHQGGNHATEGAPPQR